MLLLPVLAIFLWIFVVGLVNDWRSDPDDEPAGGFSLTRLLVPDIFLARIAGAVDPLTGELAADQPAVDTYPVEPDPVSGFLAGDDAVDVRTAT